MSTGNTDLTDLERGVLDFESGPHWNYVGAKEDEIRRRFDITATRYAQILNAMLKRQEKLPLAMAYAPVTVKRLLRLQEAQAARRTPQGPAATAPRLRSGSRGL